MKEPVKAKSHPGVTFSKTRLDQLEAIIAKGRITFLEVGRALAEIRDKKLYAERYETFDDYCAKKWEFSKQHAYRLINAVQVVESLPPESARIIDSERKARELEAVPPRKLRTVMKAATKLAKGEPVTARVLHRAVAQTSPRGGAISRALESKARAKQAESGPRGRMLAALEEWWGTNKGKLTSYGAPPTPAQMVTHFRKLIEATL